MKKAEKTSTGDNAGCLLGGPNQGLHALKHGSGPAAMLTMEAEADPCDPHASAAVIQSITKPFPDDVFS